MLLRGKMKPRIFPSSSQDIRIGNILFHLPVEPSNCKSMESYLVSLYNNTYEPCTAYLIDKFLCFGGSFMDIGANLGYFSAIAANRVGPSGKVYCFDIDDRCHDNLMLLKSHNPKYCIYPQHKVVGERSGEISFRPAENHTWNSLGTEQNGKHTGDICTVEITTLSDFIKTHKTGMPDLIKINVEGYEHEVLVGLREALQEHNPLPKIIVEISPNPDKIDMVFKLMTQYGYSAFSMIPPHSPVTPNEITGFTNVLFMD